MHAAGLPAGARTKVNDDQAGGLKERIVPFLEAFDSSHAVRCTRAPATSRSRAAGSRAAARREVLPELGQLVHQLLDRRRGGQLARDVVPIVGVCEELSKVRRLQLGRQLLHELWLGLERNAARRQRGAQVGRPRLEEPRAVEHLPNAERGCKR